MDALLEVLRCGKKGCLVQATLDMVIKPPKCADKLEQLCLECTSLCRTN